MGVIHKCGMGQWKLIVCNLYKIIFRYNFEGSQYGKISKARENFV